MVLVLGVNGGHDASWCLVRDGEIVAAFEKERFTGQKHDGGRVMDLIPPTLSRLGVSLEDIDVVATTEPVHRGTEAGLIFTNYRKYARPDEWVSLSVDLGGREVPCFSIPHHLCHASYSYYASGADDAAVITWDGGGDFYTEDAHTSTAVSYWKRGRLGWLKRARNADAGSLWFTYANAVFGDGNASGKLMGLAAYGDETLVDQFRDTFLRPLTGDFGGCVFVKDCWPDFDAPPFLRGAEGWQSQRSMDIARAVQVITEDAAVSLAQLAHQQTGSDTLCLGGGVALNGYVNQMLSTSSAFTRVFAPPAVHDGGLSVGAALFVSHNLLGLAETATGRELAFLGHAERPSDVADYLRRHSIPHVRYDRLEAEAKATQSLLRGEVIGWFSGPAEHGPRALGGRSVLALPTKPEVRTRLNSEAKLREEFRPLAPVVRESDVALYFERSEPSPWMMHISKYNDAFANAAAAACHEDGTARIQTVGPDSRLGRMLDEIALSVGDGILINTSFNRAGPIVNDANGALGAAASMGLDRLFIEDFEILGSDLSGARR